MTDEKQDNPDSGPEPEVFGKPVSDLTIPELKEAIDRGEVELPTVELPKFQELMTLENLEKFLLGDITWGQLHGMTVDEAYAIAEYGYRLFKEGRYHDGKGIFEGLIICNPYDPYFHAMAGACYQQLDMKEEARESYSTALELDPEHLHAYVNRGELRLETGDFGGALEDLRKAVELDPEGKNDASLRARALALAAARAFEAVAKMDEAEKDKPAE